MSRATSIPKHCLTISAQFINRAQSIYTRTSFSSINSENSRQKLRMSIQAMKLQCYAGSINLDSVARRPDQAKLKHTKKQTKKKDKRKRKIATRQGTTVRNTDKPISPRWPTLALSEKNASKSEKNLELQKLGLFLPRATALLPRSIIPSLLHGKYFPQLVLPKLGS